MINFCKEKINSISIGNIGIISNNYSLQMCREDYKGQQYFEVNFFIPIFQSQSINLKSFHDITIDCEFKILHFKKMVLFHDIQFFGNEVSLYFSQYPFLRQQEDNGSLLSVSHAKLLTVTHKGKVQ